MLGLSTLVRAIFDVFAVGLLVYVLAGWIQHPTAVKVRQFLTPFYTPFLTPLRDRLRPVVAGHTSIDISPAVLLLIAVVVREVVIWIL